MGKLTIIIHEYTALGYYCKKSIEFFHWLSDNNPSLLYYLDDNIDVKDDEYDELEDKKTSVIETLVIQEERFEDKYLKKYKSFPNEYRFTEDEMNLEKENIEKIKKEQLKNKERQINNVENKLEKMNRLMNRILEVGGIKTRDGSNLLRKWIDPENFCEDDHDDDKEGEELLTEFLKEKSDFEKEKNKIIAETELLTEDYFIKEGRELTIKNKLDNFINNYVLECTPLGNVYMRWNNDKGSFEYFSNNTIPYRFLEPIGRKYVITYWCRPIFIDIENELKKAEEKYDEEKRKADEKNMLKDKTKVQGKNVIASLKSYNKDNSRPNEMKYQTKNRTSSNMVLPPQIKAKLPDVNTKMEKQLLKENANRYTCEGRFSNFNPLKKIDRKLLDKNLNMTFADFKRLQQK